MTGEHDDADQLSRRRVLQRAGVTVGAFGAVPSGAFARDGGDEGQNGDGGGGGGEDGGAPFTRRMAYRNPESLGPNHVGRVLLLTDRTGERADRSAVADCSFSSWPPESLTVWEGLLVEWRDDNPAGVLGVSREVRADRLVERTFYVPSDVSDFELGSTFLVGEAVECPGDWVGVTANQVPGLRILTPDDG